MTGRVLPSVERVSDGYLVRHEPCGMRVLTRSERVAQRDAEAHRCSVMGRVPSLREKVARAIAAAADDGVFDRDEPDCTSDDEDRAYWLNLADAALIAAGLSPRDTWTCHRCQSVRYSSAGYGEHLLACSLMSEGARRA